MDSLGQTISEGSERDCVDDIGALDQRTTSDKVSSIYIAYLCGWSGQRLNALNIASPA